MEGLPAGYKAGLTLERRGKSLLLCFVVGNRSFVLGESRELACCSYYHVLFDALIACSHSFQNIPRSTNKPKTCGGGGGSNPIFKLQAIRLLAIPSISACSLKEKHRKACRSV